MATGHAEGYAAGIAEIAAAEGQLDRVSDELFRIAHAVDGSGELRETLSDPRVPSDRKAAVVEDLLGGKASPLSISIVDLVVSAGRVRELSSIADALAQRAAAIRDKAVAEVRTAVELDDATIQRLAEALGRATGKQIEIKTVVDPTVLGGVIARVGDVVIDGSLKAKLQDLRTHIRGKG